MITFPLDEAERFKVVGYIDRLTKNSGGRWQIHHYKTNSSLMTQADKAQSNSEIPGVAPPRVPCRTMRTSRMACWRASSVCRR